MLSRSPRIGLIGLGLLSLLAAPAAGGGRERAPKPVLCAVPFHNATGEKDAVATVMDEIWRHLGKAGFALVGNGRIDAFLRDHRIRARNALSHDQATEMARFLEAEYVLVGTINAWAMNGGPEVGLTARIMDPSDGGRVVWAGSASIHVVRTPGLLAMGRPRTLKAAARKAVRETFATLGSMKRNGDLVPSHVGRHPSRGLLGERPIAFLSPRLNGRTLRVAVLPFENWTLHPGATEVVGDHMLAWLLAADGVEVVDPGELRKAFIDNQIQPLYGLTPWELAVLQRELGIEAVLEGTILEFKNKTAQVPRIDLFARIRATATGEILWSATTTRDGEQGRKVYDIGVIRGIDQLTDAAVSDLLATWRR